MACILKSSLWWLDRPTQECEQDSQPQHEAVTGAGTLGQGWSSAPLRAQRWAGGAWGGGPGRAGSKARVGRRVKGAEVRATVAGVTGEGLMVDRNG